MSAQRTWKNRGLPPDQWPEADREGWRRAQAPSTPFEPELGYALRWAASSRVNLERIYSQWLAYLLRMGLLDMNSQPCTRATHEAVRGYLAVLQAADLADNTIASRIVGLGNMLSALDPSSDWSWIRRAGARLYATAKPRMDIKAKLQPAENVIQLDFDLMHAAEHDRFRTAVERAVLFRDGLLIALLVHRPLRVANFAMLTIGREVLEREGLWALEVAGNLTKTGQPISGPWPDTLHQPLERYLAVHRKTLLGCARGATKPTPRLWVSKRGDAMGSNAISFQVNDRSKEAFGRAINPHAFRSLAATTVAAVSPGRSPIIMGVLGHASMATSEQYYNRADALSAGAAWRATLAELRGVERSGPR